MNGKCVWVTGAGGLIGSYFVRGASTSAPAYRVVGLTRGELDLTDFAAVRRRFREQRPEVVVHCAALSRSAICQADPALARTLNVEVTRMLTDLTLESVFVFFSTDLVFDGRAGNYDESATVNPLSIYAETKVAAEALVLANPRHFVIRTSLNGGTSPTGDRGFNEEMRRAWKSGQRLRLFIDEFRNPIPAEVTARTTWELIVKNKPGLYHVAGSEKLSRWELGKLLAARWPQLAPQIEPASLSEYKGAPRPPDTTLNCAKAQELLSFPLPRLSDWLAGQPPASF